jgi:ABC-2 type transport system ATP-binding protein
MDTAICIDGLVKEFQGGDKKRFRAVDGLSLTVRRGEILAFLGPNGAGKTTTIKTLVGLVRPDQGQVEVNGLPVERHKAEVLRKVGAVLEGNRNIYWDLTVAENLRYWGTLKEVPPAVLRSRSEELLGFFDLADKRKTIGKQLSRGMQQKLAIACALIHDPEILLLDEPTLGLDVAAARMVKERVVQLCREQGRTIVLTTHQLDVAQELCHRVAIIAKGRLVALDDKERLLARFARPEYEFKLASVGPLAVGSVGSVAAVLRPFGDVVWQEGAALRILLRDEEALFGVMETLRHHGLVVAAVAKKEPNLEEVFVHMTEGGADAANPLGEGVVASA